MSSEPEAQPVAVIYKDACLLAVNKPWGWESVAQGGQRARCLTSRLRREFNADFLQPAHRLDRDTTGVQLFAKTPDVLAELERQFRERLVEKRYLALCLGVPNNPEGTIRRNLSPWRAGRRPVRTVKGRGGLEAVTGYRVLAAGGGGGKMAASLLLFIPHHGRTHQVRVHAAAIGYPLLGDDNYGDRSANAAAKQQSGLSRQALHAWRLRVTHPGTRRELTLTSPVPPDLAQALDALVPDWRAALAAAGNGGM